MRRQTDVRPAKPERQIPTFERIRAVSGNSGTGGNADVERRVALPYAASLSETEIAEALSPSLAAPALVYAPIPDGVDCKLGDAACYASQVDRSVLDGISLHAGRWLEPSERVWTTDLIAPIIVRGLMGRP